MQLVPVPPAAAGLLSQTGQPKGPGGRRGCVSVCPDEASQTSTTGRKKHHGSKNSAHHLSRSGWELDSDRLRRMPLALTECIRRRGRSSGVSVMRLLDFFLVSRSLKRPIDPDHLHASCQNSFLRAGGARVKLQLVARPEISILSSEVEEVRLSVRQGSNRIYSPAPTARSETVPRV